MVYSHPVAKQCTYEPDLSNYVTKDEIGLYNPLAHILEITDFGATFTFPAGYRFYLLLVSARCTGYTTYVTIQSTSETTENIEVVEVGTRTEISSGYVFGTARSNTMVSLMNVHDSGGSVETGACYGSEFKFVTRDMELLSCDIYGIQ